AASRHRARLDALPMSAERVPRSWLSRDLKNPVTAMDQLFAPNVIEPPCPRCVQARQSTRGAEYWCDRSVLDLAEHRLCRDAEADRAPSGGRMNEAQPRIRLRERISCAPL